MQKLSGRFSCDRYKNILFKINNYQVFIRDGNTLPVNTELLRNLIKRIVNDSLGFNKIGDLPFPSAISATHIEVRPLKERTFRFGNQKINNESNPDFDLVDILMASIAIQVVFLSIKLKYPDYNHQITFIDGVVAEDHIPNEIAIEYEKHTCTEFIKMIFVSRKNSPESNIGSE